MASNELKNFNKFILGISPVNSKYDFSNKSHCINQHIAYMLSRTQSMFKWSGLPETITQRSIELFLQVNGNACWYEHKGNLYVFTGGMGGEPDVYYMPTIYTISNPALNLSVNANIGVDCIVMPNDSMYLGLIPMFNRYSSLMTETELSMRVAVVNSRIMSLISAPDDRTKVSADKYLEDIESGKLSSIGENGFLDGIKVQPYSTTSASGTITNLIEMEQYLKASWFNELGLNANYNMKRESLNTSESQMNNDALLPLVDDMLNCRKKYAEKVNEMFGTSISVEFASSWEDNIQEIELEHEELSGQPENMEETENGQNDTETSVS